MPRKVVTQLRRIASLSLLVAMIGAVILPTPAFAAITDNRGNYGDCGTQMMRAYFANVCGTPYTDPNGDDGFVMPRRNIGGVLRAALYGVNTKQELYDYLTGPTGLGAADQQSRVGAAFIIHTMLGRDGNQANAAGGKTISVADRNALFASLVTNPDVTISIGSYSNRFNSGSRVVGGAIDESFFDNSLGGGTVSNVSSIILREASSGTIVYVLEVACANPIGVPRPGLDDPWTSSSSMEIRRVDPASPTTPIAAGVPGNTSVTGQVGERYGWFWSVRNNGPGATNLPVTRQRSWTFPAPYPGSGGWVSAGSTAGAGVGPGAFIFPYSNTGFTPTIQPSDAGKTFCLQTRYDPGGINGATITLPNYCVTIAYDYNLIPSVAMTSTTTAVGATPPATTYSIRNAGPSYSQGFNFVVKQFVAQPGQAVVAAMRDSVASNCGIPSVTACATDIYTSPGGLIMPVITQPITSSGAGGATNTATWTFPIPEMTAAATNLPAGSRVCRVLALSRASQSVTSRWSVPTCVTIGQKPYMAILNGDGWSGGSYKAIDSTCSIAGSQAGGFDGTYTSFPGPSYYGAFGEYELFSIGPVTDFGSAGRVRDGVLQAVKQTYKSTGVYGNYYSKTIAAAVAPTEHCLGDLLTVYGTQPTTAISGTVNPSALPASGIYKSTGDITLSTSTFATSPVKRVVIIADGNVYVDGNQQFADGNYAGPESIPSLVVIAKGSILVSQNVTRMDGVYQAYRNFTTCRESTSGGIGLSSGTCTQQLVVNGSVSANKLVLRRIAGGGTTTQRVPAEVFNMRSDILLSEYGRSKSTSQLIRTTSIQELPPRY